MGRTQNATRNIIFGMILKVYQILVPFLMRTAMIYLMGVEYLGLNSLFSSILQVLNLAELGVGAAMVFSMYKPIADNDEHTICALLKLYKKYYFLIGLAIAVIGTLLTPMMPKLVNGDLPNDLNIYILYLLNLFATVMSYWLFAYKGSLLQAYQRSDIASKVSLFTNTVQYGLQLLTLWLFHNYYIYVIIALATQVMTNIITAAVTTKMYPRYIPEGSLSKKETAQINQRIKDLFTAKLGTTVVNSADTIVISAFFGLTTLAMYQNYYFIMNSVMGMLAIVFASCLAGVGNSMVTDSIDKNYNDFRVITFLINWIVTICMCCFATVYQPFITLWVGAEYRFDVIVVALFCVYFYLVIMQQINGMYKDAAGVWHQDRFRPLIAAAFNLAFNLIFVKSLGIYAILLSTIASYVFVSMPWMIYNVFKYVFKRDWKQFVRDFLAYFFVACLITLLCYFLCKNTVDFPLVVQAVVNILISCVISNVLLVAIYRRSKYYKPMLELINKITKNKFNTIISKAK